MSFINDKIGDWTPAQLQSFIQDVVSVQDAQIPTSLNLKASEVASSKIGQLDLQTSLNTGQNIGLTDQQVPVAEGLIMGSDENNQINWKAAKEWERPHLVVGDTWAGMNYHPTVFSPSGSPSLTNQRMSMQLIELTKRTNSHGFYVNVVTAASGTFTDSGMFLYGPFTPGATGVSLLKSYQGGSSVNIFPSTGNRNVVFDGPITFIEPGWYFFGVWINMSAVTTLPALFGGGAHGVNLGQNGATTLTRSCGLDGKTTFAAASPSPLNATNASFNTYENLFWVGALQA